MTLIAVSSANTVMGIIIDIIEADLHGLPYLGHMHVDTLNIDDRL